MEIKKLLDTYRPVENRETDQKAGKSDNPARTAMQKGDRISLSPEAQTLKTVLAASHESSGVRSEKIEAIREQIAKNAYPMDSRKTAEKMLEQEYALWDRKA